MLCVRETAMKVATYGMALYAPCSDVDGEDAPEDPEDDVIDLELPALRRTRTIELNGV